jgi:hypothetical protein
VCGAVNLSFGRPPSAALPVFPEKHIQTGNALAFQLANHPPLFIPDGTTWKATALQAVVTLNKLKAINYLKQTRGLHSTVIDAQSSALFSDCGQ